MKDLERLKLSGGEEDRALLREASRDEVPAELRDRVREAALARISPPPGRRRAAWRLVIACGGTLLAGSALAYGLIELSARRWAPQAEAPRTQRPAPPASARPPHPSPASKVEPARAPAEVKPRRGAAPGSRITSLPSLGRPGLAGPPSGVMDNEAPPPAPPPPSVGAGHLLIQHQGRRPVSILLRGQQLSGDVRGAPVNLEIVGQRILGKAADQPFSLLLRGREADGSIAGQDVAFELAPTRDGAVVRGSLPGHSARVELTGSTLSWFPGCNGKLTLTGPGVYQGSCEGGQTRVVLPEAWQRLPQLTRLILLAVFLTEREPGLPDRPPSLFGPPDWPASR